MIVEKVRCNLCPAEIYKASVFPATWLQFKITKHDGKASMDWHVCPECRPKLPQEFNNAVALLNTK